jgi:crotonobetainyl-CoA:carnitine CoA-transferase CaiB-like acyl-CoA transferase
MTTLFENLRVLDLSSVLAGPSVATFFAELGAHVTKVENPLTQGDVTRSWKLPSEAKDSRVSAYFSSVNYKKEYLWLNLGSESDREQLDEHIRQSDIVIVNFKFGDDVKFKLTYEEVRAMRPDIIYAAIKGFDSNPKRVAYDVVLQAETGFMHMNGTPESGPVKMPVAFMDVLAAHQLKEGILCALWKKVTTGEGSLVECSLERAGLASLVNQASNYLMAGKIPERLGSLHPNIAPYGEIFYCSDEKALVLAIGSDKHFRMMCEILGNADLATDEKFASNQERVKNRKLLAGALSPHFEKQPRVYWMEKFVAADVPAGAILSMDEVMQNTAAQNMILEETIENETTRRLSSVAFKIQH